jgi:hypothetical protein
MHGKRRSARRACAVAGIILVALAALAGGAGTGRAGATLLDVDLEQLESINSISAGGTVGYTASVLNDGPSTVSHLSFVVSTTIVNSAGKASYRVSEVDGDGAPSCAADADDSSRLVCTASQLAPQERFSVDVAFAVPSNVAAIDEELPISLRAKAVATVSAQTNGNPGNQGTSTWSNEDDAPPVSTTLTEESDLSFRTYSLPGDAPFEVGVALKTKIDLPPAFLNDHFGLVTEAGEVDGIALCDKCPTVFSRLSIPASLLPATNPFVATFNTMTGTGPYTFELTLNPAGQPKGYKPSGIQHLGDKPGAVWESVPLCSDVILGSDDPICLDALPSKDKKTGEITATGKGIENGSFGYD